MTVTYTVGDTREVIKGIPDGSVDLLATSPPFYQLRSYVGADHESKSSEIGSEPDPATFLDTLLALTAEWGRVLASHGSIAVELGDTYSGSGGAGGDYNDGGLRDGENKFLGSARAQRQTNSLKANPKSLACIPDLYTIALAYGIHPLTGKESPAGKWLVRNKIVWHRPNPAVGALGDKVRPSTSYIVIATRSAKRWFDLTAVRTPYTELTLKQHGPEAEARRGRGSMNGTKSPMARGMENGALTHAGAPPLDAWFDHYDGTHDTWTLTTQPSRISVKVPTRVPCGPDDGGERTTSPDCPVHGDRADPAPTALDDALAADSPLHTSRTGDHRGLVPQRFGACDAETSSCLHRTRSSATRCDTESSRTDLDQSTSALGTPSVETVVDTARTPESPELFGDRPDTSASSSDEVCPPVDGHETAPRSDHTLDPESACSCTFHLEKDSIHSHYAMWPAKLAERLVLSMCPREVCRVCGVPRRRIEGAAEYVSTNGGRVVNQWAHDRVAEGVNTWDVAGGNPGHAVRTARTLGWTDCGHVCPACDGKGTTGPYFAGSTLGYVSHVCHDCDGLPNYRPGLVLDPFAGSGTTLAVADLHGRDAIGIDFDARNKAIYPARYDEVSRALFGTKPELPGQGDLFAEVAG